MRSPLGGALAGALLLAPLVAAAGATRIDYSAELSTELRAFLHEPVYARQSDDAAGLSLSLLPELYVEWSRDTSLTVTPFARWDSIDDERTHADLRELALQHRWGDFDLRAGVSRVFWGVTESVHLVDIINQTDEVENLDGEDKLGQPMLNLSWVSAWGTFSGFVLPYFRERTLPGTQARLRGQFAYDGDAAIYESDDEERHVDAALRWSLSTSLLDVGLSHFSGTARTPRFAARVDAADPGALAELLDQLGLLGLLARLSGRDGVDDVDVRLIPVYDQIEQTGLDVNLVSGGWIWKLEAIHQQRRIEDFTAVAGGFEYTFAGFFGTGWDVGALIEYLWDSRGEPQAAEFGAEDLVDGMLPAQDVPPLMQNDLFFGTRLAANDVAGSELLAGAVVDLDNDSVFVNLEASRRIGTAGKLIVELRLFENTAPEDLLYQLREDDYLQIEYVRYF